MTPSEFKSWRKSLKLTQKEAAHKLGLKPRIIQYYEKGERNGSSFAVPRSVELACFPISLGIERFPGKDALKRYFKLAKKL
jgi:transcriptional regulator with XRE-family HTH domain